MTPARACALGLGVGLLGPGVLAAFLRPLREVDTLLVRGRDEKEWTPTELDPLLAAEPEPCETL